MSSVLQEGNGPLSSEGELSVRRGVAPRIQLRLAACLLLLVICVAAPFAVLLDHEEAFRWGQLFAIVGLAVMMRTIVRSETTALWRRLRAAPLLRERWNWVQLCLVTIIVVLLMETVSIANYGHLQLLPYTIALVLNSFLLILLACVVFLLTNRFAFSVTLIYSLYLLAGIANIIKAQYLLATIRPLDIHYLLAFEEFAPLFFGTAVIALTIMMGGVWAALMTWIWYKARYRAKLRTRAILGTFSILGIVGLMLCDKAPATAYLLACLDLQKNMSNEMHSAERRGFLFEFLSDIPDSIPRTPANYSQAEVARVLGEHGYAPTPAATIPESPEHVNVVFHLIESFMDPMDLHLKFTSDPIPAFREARRHGTAGYVVVPKECCGSTSTEFEVLTGMSCTFLPEGACPYVQYVKRDIPSLISFFQEHGYATVTAHAGPPCLYNRVPVYQHMNVGETIWLTERIGQDGVHLDMALRNPSDEALVDSVIEFSKTHRRYFMYASANATHSPYNYDGYAHSDLDVCDPLSEPARNELKTYLNAVRTADRAIEKLLKHFQRTPQKTIVVIIGDHWPPFANAAEIYAKSGYSLEPDASALPTKRRVPLLIWSNFSGKSPDIVRSTNFLGAEILARIGIRPTGLLALNDALRADLSVLSKSCLRTQDGKQITQESASARLAHLLNDYQLLQYDLLLGKQYAQTIHRKIASSQSADNTQCASACRVKP